MLLHVAGQAAARTARTTDSPGQVKAPVFLELDLICDLALAVVVVDAGGRPQRKRWIMEVHRYVYDDPQLVRVQRCV